MQGIVSTACRGSLFPRKNDLPRPSPRDPFYGLVFYRLSASHSLIKGYNLYAYPAREHFCSAKSAQKRFRAAALKTRNAWLRWIRILIFCGSRKSNPYGAQMRSKGICDASLSPPRWSAEGRTTTPLPSSKEGNKADSELTLISQLPPISIASGICRAQK